jgi:hypothetical protein
VGLSGKLLESIKGKCMQETNEAQALDRRIAADLLVALIAQGRVKPGGASAVDEVVIDATAKAYERLLAGISSAKFDE